MVNDDMIKTRYDLVMQEINQASIRAHRNSNSVNLVVVTKFKPVDQIKEVIEAGTTILGENYPEETEKKIAEMGSIENPICWHMIGHLQGRKAKIVAQHFTMIHSIDSLDIARELNKRLLDVNKQMTALFEVNISGEESKHGFPGYVKETWPALVDEWITLQQETSALKFIGLMTMPPYTDQAEDSRQYFKKCHEFLDFAQKRMNDQQFVELSMGTSLDYEVAVEEGATYVRVGEAIMGKREKI
jgi:PLP dependent protein